MINLLYDIFIYPLEFLMQIVLGYSIGVTGGPLLSLVILSFSVSVISLPVYHIAEKWQDKERSIQKKLKPKIDEFKSIFKGAVLNTYINTLYRQNNYHPFHAVRSSFGLLIQIPFFFAAYHLLSNYPYFNGMTAFIFKDLGKPDGLVKIGGAVINILPFIMTAVNLLSSAVYSKKLGRNEKVQVYGISILFLLLLYNASSALLIYWTCNNLFSLFKNLVYGRIYAGGVIEKGSSSVKLDLKPVFLKIYENRPSGWVLFIMLLVSAVAYLSLYDSRGSFLDHTVPVLIVIFLPLFIVLVYAFSAMFKKTSGMKLLKFIPEAGRDENSIFKLSLTAYTILAFIAAPMSVLSSGSESDFEGTLYFFLSYLVSFSILFILLFIFVYNSLNRRMKRLCSIAALFILIYGLVNGFIFSGNYGDMSHFVFNEGIELKKTDIAVNILAGIVILVLSITAMKLKRFGLIKSLVVIIIISSVFFSAKEAFSFLDKRNASVEVTSGRGADYVFSSKGKNVLIIMLDRFIGGYMPQILELMPELRKDLDGFILYPRSLTSASYTLGGVPAILGGWEYTVRSVNTDRPEVPLKKKLDESVRIMPFNFQKAGFDVMIYQNDFINWSDKVSWLDRKNREYIDDTVFVSPDYPKFRDAWLEKYKQNVQNDDDTVRKKLLAFGLFRSSPLFLREFFYDNGDWHLDRDDQPKTVKTDDRKQVSFFEKSKYKRDTTLKYYAALDLLSDLSRVSDDGKSRFMYISNNMTHEPHSINSRFEYEITGRVSYPKSIYDKFNRSLNSLKHLYTDGAALRMVNEWLKWMKKAGVYDNTRIIIVSDHGRDVYNPFFKQQKIPGGRSKNHAAYFNNLLLVKDFNSSGELSISDEFMSSADVPSIAMAELIEGTNPYTGRRIAPPENKFPFYAYDIQWRIEKQSEFKYIYHEAYEINENDVSNPGKWKLLPGN